MKPTRNIVKPNTGLWKPKGSVWFKENDDSELGDWDEDNPEWVEIKDRIWDKHLEWKRIK